MSPPQRARRPRARRRALIPEIKGCPPIVRRRPHDERWPEGYLEGDRDYVLNNLGAAVWLLDRAGGGGGGRKL